jgi:hypothetical protein
MVPPLPGSVTPFEHNTHFQTFSDHPLLKLNQFNMKTAQLLLIHFCFQGAFLTTSATTLAFFLLTIIVILLLSCRGKELYLKCNLSVLMD